MILAYCRKKSLAIGGSRWGCVSICRDVSSETQDPEGLFPMEVSTAVNSLVMCYCFSLISYHIIMLHIISTPIGNLEDMTLR